MLGGWVLNGTQNNLERRNGDMIDRIGNLNNSSESAGHQNTPKTIIEQQVKTEHLFETKRDF